MISLEAHNNLMAAKDFDYAVTYYERLNTNARLMYEVAFNKLLEFYPDKTAEQLQSELSQIAVKNGIVIC